MLDVVILFAILARLGLWIQRALGLDLAQTGPEVARVILWNFSLPAWLYFTISDQSTHGATLGTRLVKLRVSGIKNKPVSPWRALLRTAVKLLPWEMVHFFGFALSSDFFQLTVVQTVGLFLANVLTIFYAILFLFTRGRRSVYDFAAQTVVTMV